MSAPLLEVTDLSVVRLRKPVLRSVSLRIAEKERVALVGHNGAGKSTLLRALLGLLPAVEGRVVVAGTDVSGATTKARVRAGLSLAPQAAGFFPNLTVAENLDFAHVRGGYLDEEGIFALFPRLAERRHQQVGSMSGGERQMVAISVALMAAPRLLMLDEPSLGLAPAVVDDVLAALRRVHDDYGVSMLLVEQNVLQAAAFAERMYVLNQGAIAREGAPTDVLTEDVWDLV